MAQNTGSYGEDNVNDWDRANGGPTFGPTIFVDECIRVPRLVFVRMEARPPRYHVLWAVTPTEIVTVCGRKFPHASLRRQEANPRFVCWGCQSKMRVPYLIPEWMRRLGDGC